MKKQSAKETVRKFHLVLSLSDEGIQLMMQRVRRNKPNASDADILKILRKEHSSRKSLGLPKHIVPVTYKQLVDNE